jgi:hypothetical protein
MQNGKGPEPRQGANYKSYWDNYPDIKGFKSNENKKSKDITGDDITGDDITGDEPAGSDRLPEDGAIKPDDDLSVPHPD